MKRIILMLLLFAATASAQMGLSGGHDLDALAARAAAYDLENLDAVLLLEEHDIVLENGDRTTRVHRVVWIGTRAGLGAHADLRIPWNADFAELEVLKLRTWRDGRWWPDAEAVSPTAVVETLPHALAHAYDYSGMRETMLLHDGVELPCILETEYAITERGVARDGDDGLFVFPQNDPSVRTVLRVAAAGGLRAIEHNGVPAADAASTSRTWTLEDVPRLRLPHTADPAVYEPCVRWTTRKGWPETGDAFTRPFRRAPELDDALLAELRDRLDLCLSPYEELRAVTGLVDETVADVRYDPRAWWPFLRSAGRVHETAYAHALDRTVLLLALLKEADLMPQPVFELTARGGFDPELPCLHVWDTVRLRVDRVLPGLLLDPVDGSLSFARDHDRRVRWEPIFEDAPEQAGDLRAPSVDPDAAEALPDPGLLKVRLDLAATETGWDGRGGVEAEHALSPWAAAAGADGELQAWFDGLTSSLLPGAEPAGVDLLRFGPEAVEGTVAFALPLPEADAFGRLPLTIGDPAGGVLALLPHDVDPSVERRESPVLLEKQPAQVVSVRVETGGREIVAAPADFELRNGAGLFRVTVERTDDAVVIERWLSLGHGPVPPERWSDLRALLLEESDPVHRTVLLK